MKKQFSYLLLLMLIFSAGKVANTCVAADLHDLRVDSGAYNKMELDNLRNYTIDKSYVQSLDYLDKDERIYDASVEENIAREGALYNPHFLLEKIVFEGNTKIPDEELQKLGLEVLGEDIFFDELLEVSSNVTN